MVRAECCRSAGAGRDGQEHRPAIGGRQCRTPRSCHGGARCTDGLAHMSTLHLRWAQSSIGRDDPRTRPAARPPPSPGDPGRAALFRPRDDQGGDRRAPRISRFRVARLLDGALADGPSASNTATCRPRTATLARRSRNGSGSTCARSPPDGASPHLAGTVLDGADRPDDVVGIAWGSTLAAVVARSRAVPTPVEVVQLAGSSVRLDRGRDAGELARGVWPIDWRRPHRAIYAPAFVGTRAAERPAARARGRRDGGPVPVDRPGHRRDRGHAGRGHRRGLVLVRSGVLAPTRSRRSRPGRVGDLVGPPVRRDRRFVAPDLAARAIAIGVDALRAVPRRRGGVRAGQGGADPRRPGDRRRPDPRHGRGHGAGRPGAAGQADARPAARPGLPDHRVHRDRGRHRRPAARPRVHPCSSCRAPPEHARALAEGLVAAGGGPAGQRPT